MAATDAALKRWAHPRTQTIDLPSGVGKATVRLITIPEAITLGKIPNPLVGIAIRAESGGLDKDLSEDDVKAFLDLQASVVAQQLERFSPKKGNGLTGPLEAEWVKFEMPPRDREHLFAVITHILPAQLLNGILANSLMDGAPFRGGSGGTPDVGGDGGDGNAAVEGGGD